MDSERTYTISEVAREVEVSEGWLREGDKRGSLPAARPDEHNHRVYTASDVTLLKAMGCGQRPRRLKSSKEAAQEAPLGRAW